jgi:hypothetical protein
VQRHRLRELKGGGIEFRKRANLWLCRLCKRAETIDRFLCIQAQKCSIVSQETTRHYSVGQGGTILSFERFQVAEAYAGGLLSIFQADAEFFPSLLQPIAQRASCLPGHALTIPVQTTNVKSPVWRHPVV